MGTRDATTCSYMLQESKMPTANIKQEVRREEINGKFTQQEETRFSTEKERKVRYTTGKLAQPFK